MMDNKQILQAMTCLDPQLIEEAAVPADRRPRRIHPMLIAACLCLLIVIPVMAVTGSLLVEHYYGEDIPDNLGDQELDAFFRANATEKIPVSALSQQVLDAAAAQTEPNGYYGFETWDEAEAFLGLNILDSDQLLSGHPVDLLDQEDRLILRTPCHLTLHNKQGRLYSMGLNYFFLGREGTLITLNANAVTDQNPNDNNASLGVSNESSHVLQQTGESYLTASGAQATIISTEYSDGHGWNIDGWMQKNGFVLRFSLSANHNEDGKTAIKELLDSIQ